MSDVTYKVLWVDDDESIVVSTQLNAEDYNIMLDHYTNWQDAEKVLRKNFHEYSAVILDANCKIRRDSLEQEEFITAILPSLLSIFGEKRQYIPWYILSAGTMSNFESVVKGAKYQHSNHESEWGNMLYLKDALDESPQSPNKLFENIQRVAMDMSSNIVLYRHSDVFEYLGEGKIIDERARTIMLKMLSALYYPQENIKYEYAGNPLRKVVEYIFRSARRQGLLAEECFDKDDHIQLLDASRYMGGLNTNFYEGRTVKGQIRWGTPGKGKDGAEGDSVFTRDIAMIVKNTLNYSSSDSHTDENKPYFIDENNKEYFFAYVMQLCHLIKWYGKYVVEHPDVQRNKAMKQVIPAKEKDTKNISIKPAQLSVEKLKGSKYLIQHENGLALCNRYKLSDELQNRTGMVTIEDIVPNNGADKDKYPYIITKVR